MARVLRGYRRYFRPGGSGGAVATPGIHHDVPALQEREEAGEEDRQGRQGRSRPRDARQPRGRQRGTVRVVRRRRTQLQRARVAARGRVRRVEVRTRLRGGKIGRVLAQPRGPRTGVQGTASTHGRDARVGGCRPEPLPQSRHARSQAGPAADRVPGHGRRADDVEVPRRRQAAHQNRSVAVRVPALDPYERRGREYDRGGPAGDTATSLWGDRG
mmetsp:Transcript_3235/g.14649  ORF Transcript_3235/g.14649 Transcript_3235/m.14649 type:complete len:215 (-) Transcript_3235:528-1172(-)